MPVIGQSAVEIELEVKMEGPLSGKLAVTTYTEVNTERKWRQVSRQGKQVSTKPLLDVRQKTKRNCKL